MGRKWMIIFTVVVFVVLLLVATLGWVYGAAVRSGDYTKAGIVRLHVLANSDTDEDQALKRRVRDAVISYMKPYMQISVSRPQAEQIIADHLPMLQAIAQQVVHDNGYDYPVRVELGQHLFPTKTYGNLALPAGNYQALRVLIGKAEGQNWWCILFPPLCFVDVTNSLAVSAQTQQVNDEISKQQTLQITDEISKQQTLQITDEISKQQTLEIRCKLWDWWHENKEQPII